VATSGKFGYRVEGRQGAVKVEGLAKVRRDLKNLSDDVDYRAMEFLPVNKSIADAVAGDALSYVPFRTGNLKASIRASATKTSARVKAGGRLTSAQRAIVGSGYGQKGSVEYAGPIHFGWPARFIKPQPFFYDSIDKRRGEIAQRYAELVSKLISKYDLK
jgi:hypothetical protein